MEQKQCCFCDEYKPREEVTVLYPYGDKINYIKTYICSDCVKKYSFTDDELKERLKGELINDYFCEYAENWVH